ncbi:MULTISPECIES: hypothetical protein [Rhodococcus erythropolis group]|uniref:hypothetical protein n=1 Tax=Rhodococcus erythropolis group TaxID=2840174 RepID=UPI001BE7F5F1|nr:MULTISPECIES: hypothetical protein [Rhodococcus erythropolis group]MBT2269691.1 hypothetical protein [Rhodococcus erythropolis]MBT2273955.1 hypothetical protein [Rhodococcus qingshengii]
MTALAHDCVSAVGPEYSTFRILHIRQSTFPAATDHPGYDEAAGTGKGVQRLHRVGARLAPLGKWPLEAAFLLVVPGAKNVSTDSLYNEHPHRVIPVR